MADQTFDAGGVAINYAVEGRPDGPPIVFLHGVTGRWQAWLPVMMAFAADWRLYALDQRGHGLSGRAPRYHVVDYAADAVAFLRGVVRQPAVLVGHSLGAIVGIAVAAQAPDAVRALVIEDPPLGAFDDQVMRDRAEHPRFTATRELARRRLGRDEMLSAVCRLLPDADAATVGQRAVTLSQMDPEVLTPILEDTAKEGYDLPGCLRRITCPTFLQQGNPALGAALEDERAARARALLADCTFQRFPEVGHGIHSDAPFIFAGAVREILAQLRG